MQSQSQDQKNNYGAATAIKKRTIEEAAELIVKDPDVKVIQSESLPSVKNIQEVSRVKEQKLKKMRCGILH